MTIHSRELDGSEIDVNRKRPECVVRMRTEIDLNESEIDPIETSRV